MEEACTQVLRPRSLPKPGGIESTAVAGEAGNGYTSSFEDFPVMSKSPGHDFKSDWRIGFLGHLATVFDRTIHACASFCMGRGG